MTRSSAPSATASSASRRPRPPTTSTPRRLPHPAPAQDARDRGLARRRGARQVQGRRPDPQRRPRAARASTRTSRPALDERQGGRRGPRRVPLGAVHRAPAVRLRERDRHPAPRAPRPRRPRTGPATRPPSRSSRRSPAESSRTRSTSRRSRPRTWRCSARTCRSAPPSAGSRIELAAGLLGRGPADRVFGRLADRDTRLLSIEVLRGVLAGHMEEEVNAVNAPAMAEERGSR